MDMAGSGAQTRSDESAWLACPLYPLIDPPTHHSVGRSPCSGHLPILTDGYVAVPWAGGTAGVLRAAECGGPKYIWRTADVADQCDPWCLHIALDDDTYGGSPDLRVQCTDW
jgi:hypothetical protein